MRALLQTGAPIDVYRDGDVDEFSEELGVPKAGWYGINYHTNTYDFSISSKKMVKKLIDGWSAGCQVINERDKYDNQMNWYENAFNTKAQEYVTYCLIKEF